MEITAVVIDEEYTFADALAIRLNAEEDIIVAAVAWPDSCARTKMSITSPEHYA